YVRSVYTCSGYVTLGPLSTIESTTTLSSGCRGEENEVVADDPAAQLVSADNGEMVSLYPNPNSGQFTLDISRISMEEEQVRIEVMNLVGQTVVTHFASVNNGLMNESINLPKSVTSGTYFVRVTVGKNVYTSKVNISK